MTPAQQLIYDQILQENKALRIARQEAENLAAVLQDPAGQQALKTKVRLLQEMAEAEKQSSAARRKAEEDAYFGRKSMLQEQAKEAVTEQLRQENEEIEKQTEKMRALQDLWKSPQGKQQAQDRLKAIKELHKEEEKARRGQRAAEVGGLAEGFENIEKKLVGIRDVLKGMGSGLGSVFGGMSAGILGLAAAADGGSIYTYTLAQSFRELGQAAGTAFGPAILTVSKLLQDAAGWVRGLDDETKSSIAKWTLFATAVAGGGFALVKLGAIIWGVAVPAWKALRFAVVGTQTAMLALGASGPVAAVAAATVAVLALGAAFLGAKAGADALGGAIEGLDRNDADRRKKQQDKDAKRLRLEDLHDIPEKDRKRILEEKGPEGMLKKMQDIEKEYKKDLEKEQEKRLEKLKGLQGFNPLEDFRKRGEALRSEIGEQIEKGGLLGASRDPSLIRRYFEMQKESKELGRKFGPELRKQGIEFDEEEQGRRPLGITREGGLDATPGGMLLKALADLEKQASKGVEGAREKLEKLQKAMEKAGLLTSPEGGRRIGEGPDLAIRPGALPQPRLMEAGAYQESLQLKSLESEAQGDEVMKNQLNELKEINKVLQGVGGLLERVNDSIKAMPLPFGY